jgi:hypothetical protein
LEWIANELIPVNDLEKLMQMKQRILLLILLCSTVFAASAQLTDGSIAPDWTATDIDGVEHNL